MRNPHLKLALDCGLDEIVCWVELEYETQIAPPSGNRNTFTKSHNLRQNSFVPVIYRRTPTDPKPVVDAMQWRLVPREWSEDKYHNTAITKVETVVERDFYRLRANHRCAAICQGFYVWRNKGQTPYYYQRSDGNLVMLAGLYDVNQKIRAGDAIHSFTLLYSEQDKKCYTPVVLQSAADLASWLDTSSDEWNDLLHELVTRGMDSSAFTAHKVSAKINNADVDSPDLIQPLDMPIKDAFDPQSASSRATTVEPGASGRGQSVSEAYSRQSTRPPDSEAGTVASALSRASSVSHARTELGEAVSARLSLRPDPPRARSTQLPSRTGRPRGKAARSASRASTAPSTRGVSVASRASSRGRDARDDFAVLSVLKRGGVRAATPTKPGARTGTSTVSSRTRASTARQAALSSPLPASPVPKPARGRQATSSQRAGPSRRSPSGSPLTDIPDSPASAKARSPRSPLVSPRTSNRGKGKGKRRASERSSSIELLSTPPQGSVSSPARKKVKRTPTRTLRPRT